jgi:hypothetical protein
VSRETGSEIYSWLGEQEVVRPDDTEWLIMRVSDTGIGMTAEQIERLFKAFTQADASTTRKYGGTGLGLAISRHFCQMMGGDILVESTPDIGSTFTVYFPTEVQEPRQEEQPKPQSVSPMNEVVPIYPPDVRLTDSLPRVLVIDDDESARDLMRHFLLQEGFAVITAASGEEGITLAKRLRPDVVTLDVMMPHMDGWAVLIAFQEAPELVDIPVIITTIVDDKNIGFALGATAYLMKPIDRQRLSGLLQKYRRDPMAFPAGRILIAEDDMTTRDLLRRILQQEGWEVTEAQDGQVALECVIQQPPDLILLDLMMPTVDGFQVVSTLRAKSDWQTIPIIVITAKQLTAEDRQRLNGSVQRTLQKGSYRREDLLREIRYLLPAHTSQE